MPLARTLYTNTLWNLQNRMHCGIRRVLVFQSALFNTLCLCRTHGRGVWLRLTEEGQRRIARAAMTAQKANDDFFSSLDNVHFLILSDIAARLEKSSDKAVKNFSPEMD